MSCCVVFFERSGKNSIQSIFQVVNGKLATHDDIFHRHGQHLARRLDILASPKVDEENMSRLKVESQRGKNVLDSRITLALDEN